MTPEVVVTADADALADEVVGRLLVALAAAQADPENDGRAALCLTAGGIMERVWSAGLAHDEAAGAVDWARVDVYAGDERFVPSDSADRNDRPAERMLFEHAPFSAAARYWMPASDGAYGADLDAAAAGYARTLGEHRRPGDSGAVPAFDVVLLGIGPDGHCCSLFPDHPSSTDLSAAVIPVRDSPKPPPLRLSLSFDGLNCAREIWVVASGSGKADAVKAALGGADRTHVPSAGAVGTRRTLWLLDADAAAELS